MSSIFDDITKNIQNLLSGKKVTPTETVTFKPSPYAVPAEFLGLQQTYFEADPFYRFFSSALEIVRGSNLPDGTQLGSEVKLVGLDGIDFGNYFYKIADWYTRANLYDTTKPKFDALTGKFNQLSGLVLPDGTGLFDPLNIILSDTGADASRLASKLVDWYNHVGLYNQLLATYEQTKTSLQNSLDAAQASLQSEGAAIASLQNSLNTANQQLQRLSGIVLPDQTALFSADNILLPQVDTSVFISRVTQWWNQANQYGVLKPLYDALNVGWNTVMGFTLPDGSRFTDNIIFGSIDFTPLINKLNAWYAGNSAFNSIGAVKLSGALANFSLLDMLKDAAGQLNLGGFTANLTNLVNTAIDNYVVKPVEDFATQLAVEILKLVFRVQAFQIRVLIEEVYGLDELLAGAYWTLNKGDYDNVLTTGFQLFNTIADVLLPGIGFRFQLIDPRVVSWDDGSFYAGRFRVEVYNYGASNNCYLPHYTFCYFRSITKFRPTVVLNVPQCYGKAADWGAFVASAFDVPLSGLLNDLRGPGKGGINWAGVVATGNQQTILNMSLGSDKNWFGGRNNFINNWFGSLKLNPFDLTKIWSARTPVGTDANPQTYVLPQSGSSVGTYTTDAPPPIVTVSTVTTPAAGGGTTTTTTTTTRKYQVM